MNKLSKEVILKHKGINNMNKDLKLDVIEKVDEFLKVRLFISKDKKILYYKFKYQEWEDFKLKKLRGKR